MKSEATQAFEMTSAIFQPLEDLTFRQEDWEEATPSGAYLAKPPWEHLGPLFLRTFLGTKSKALFGT
jgi:hypothetical protein